MIRGISYSRPLAAGALAALSLVGGLFLLRMTARADLSKQRRVAEAAEGTLNRQMAGLSAYQSENLETLRRRIAHFQSQLGTDGTWERIVRRLGSAWVAECGTRQDRSGYYLQDGTFTLVAHAVDEWPGIVDAVRDIEAIPGAAVSGIEMKASGTAERRALDKTTIQVEVKVSRAETNLPKKT
jgi:hypothetical protein